MNFNFAWWISLLLILTWTISCTFGLVYYNEAEFKKLQEQKSTSIGQTLRVNPGDMVRIIAPGGPGVSPLPPIISYVQSLGLVANMTENIYEPFEPFFHANTDEFRVHDFISALLDDSTKIIWCIRGGRGSSRLIPLLEQRLPATLDSKIFIGQSDITVLHLYLQKKYGWQTIHGSNLDYIAINFYDESEEARKSLEALEDLIFERQDSICYPYLMTKLDENPPVAGIESKVVGGNYELVETSLRTFWQVSTQGKILFLEGVGEAAWRIERSFDHMRHAGVFDQVEAVIFGDFIRSGNDTLADIVLKRFAQSVPFPVFKISGIGHDNINYPLPFNTPTQISRISAETYRLCVNNLQSVGNVSNDSNDIKISDNFFKRIIIVISSLFLLQKLK